VRNKRWYVDHEYYALEYDTAQRHAVWVAFVFNNILKQKNTVRSNAWSFDPKIPREFQSLNSSSQTFSAFQPPTLPLPVQRLWSYDRGHIMASEDRVFSDEANRTTFYFSNMSPQVAWFNQQLWQNLESQVRKWAGHESEGGDIYNLRVDTMYVVKGAAINPPGTRYTVNGVEQMFGGVEVIDRLAQRNHVVVPKWWFMALVQRIRSSSGNPANDTFHGIAFWMENKGSAASGFPEGYTSTSVTRQYALTIRELEQRVGINFFHNLDTLRMGLQETVENTPINWDRWPGVN
jgi:endonuclease G